MDNALLKDTADESPLCEGHNQGTNQTQLHDTTINDLDCHSLVRTIQSAALQKIPYDRSALQPRIVHFGPSNFFGAHLGTIVEDYNCKFARAGEKSLWGIAVISMRSSDRVEMLQKQDHLYSVGEIHPHKRDCLLVGSVIDSVYSPGNPQKVAELLKHSNLVTLTITQNGYNVDVTNKPPTLSTTPEVLFDSEVLNQRLAGKSFEEIGEGLGYKTALASIVEELARRFLTKELPPAIMSLDNTPPAPNGEVIRAALIGFAQRVEQQSEQEDGKNSLRGFTGFIESDLPILHTVVDRITPNQDSIDRLWIEEAMEFFDPATIVTEGHRSLIIQVDDPKKYIDRGIVSIPDLTIVEGVCEVPDIRPEMELKSRCLNSLDVVAAQIGTRLGLKTIGQFVTHPVLAALEDRVLATELARGVVSVDRRRADEFAEEVVQRRENLEISGINILSRLNNKGSDKMPNRIGAAIAAVSCAHETEEALTLTFACYLRNIIDKTDENGNELHLQDDAPDRIRDIVQTFNSRGEAIVRRELSRNPAILRIIDNGDKLRKTEEYGNESNFEATNSKELHRDFYTSESINSGYNFRQGLDNARKLLTDEGYGELGDELVQIYEEAGIRGVLEEQTWLFGQGTDENGMLVKVGEIQTFQRRLIEYYTAMDKHSVIDVALTIANPIKRPEGYNP